MPRMSDKNRKVLQSMRAASRDKPISAMLKKKNVGIDELLSRDDVTDLIHKLIKASPDISDCVVVYKERSTGQYAWIHTDDMVKSTGMWMLEATKLDILNDVGE